MKQGMWKVSFSKQPDLAAAYRRVFVIADDGEAAIKKAKEDLDAQTPEDALLFASIAELRVSELELLGQES